jgi:hypothetical protein
MWSSVRFCVLFTASVLGAAFAPSASQATPVTYGFSTYALTFLSCCMTIDQAVANARSTVLANPGVSTPGWDGTLSYDSVTGILNVSLLAPNNPVAHPLDIGGTLALGPVTDGNALGASLANGLPFPQFFELPALTIYGWPGQSIFGLEAPGLISGGSLAEGLTFANLSQGYLVEFGHPFDNPSVMHNFGCPAEEALIDCAYDGYEHLQNDPEIVVFEFSDFHQLPDPVPEPGTALLLLGVVSLFGLRRIYW